MVLVKSSGGEKPLAEKLARNKLQNRALICVLRCGNIAFRFVQYNIYVFIFAYFVAAKKNFVVFPHFIIGKLYNGAVYGGFSVRYGGFYFLSRKVGSVRYVFVKALRGKEPPFVPPFRTGLISAAKRHKI